MSQKELTLMRRAFWLGYRRGLNKAQAKMRARVDEWEAEIASCQDEFQALLSEMRCARDEQAAQEALVERLMHPDVQLN